jgi:hypothetical protein
MRLCRTHERIFLQNPGRWLLPVLLFFLLSAGDICGEVGRFADNRDGTVTDRLTGLMWTKDADPAADSYDWFRALDAVSRFNEAGYCGYNDWRIPNVNELASLIDRGRHAPALPAGHPFRNIHVWYWTGTTTADYSNHAWRIYSFLGHIDYGHKYYMFNHVWPVRTAGDASFVIPKTGQQVFYYKGDDGFLRNGRGLPEERFADNGDDTVTDRVSGLMWTKSADLPLGRKDWVKAGEFIARLNAEGYCGYRDWRLPEVADLRTLIDYAEENPVLPEHHPFLHVSSGIYWSSEPNVQDPRYVWCVDLKNSRVDCYNKLNHRQYVWPVRGGG